MKIKHWETFAFVVTYHLLLIALLPFCIAAFSWTAFTFFLLTYIMGGMAITVGYHRLYAHKAYSANPFFEWVILLSSTLAFEMSALAWSHDHRNHHNHVDTERDPYSIKKGFWYAHVFWLFDCDRTFDEDLVSDLVKNPRVAFQHKYYLLLTVVINLAVFFIGWAIIGNALASFYFGFLLRMAMIHHCTWFINSLCHTYGSKTYARELSAVDNAILAVLTFGEGYHNYHHAFAADYRNGIRWYHFDPSKWTIWLASKLGMTGKLRTINTLTVQKSLVQKDRKLLMDHLKEEACETAAEFCIKVENLSALYEEKSAALSNKLREFKQATAEQHDQLKEEIQILRAALKQAWEDWVALTKLATKQFQLHLHAH